jgi:hypothetical protein
MSGQSDDLIREFWPDHIACLDTNANGLGAQSYEDEGVVCPCGTILGWPDESATAVQDDHLADRYAVAGDAPGDVQAAEFNQARNAPYDDPDGRLFDQQGPDPDDREAEEQQADTSGDLVPMRSTDLRTQVTPEDPINARLQAIDPTRVYTPTDIEMQMVDIEGRLERGQVFQRVWEDRALKAGLAYELAYARAMATCDESSADRRKAACLLACEAELTAKVLSESMAKSVANTMHNLRSQLSGYQSIARSIGSSMSVAGTDMDRERFAGSHR